MFKQQHLEATPQMRVVILSVFLYLTSGIADLPKYPHAHTLINSWHGVTSLHAAHATTRARCLEQLWGSPPLVRTFPTLQTSHPVIQQGEGHMSHSTCRPCFPPPVPGRLLSAPPKATQQPYCPWGPEPGSPLLTAHRGPRTSWTPSCLFSLQRWRLALSGLFITGKA